MMGLALSLMSVSNPRPSEGAMDLKRKETTPLSTEEFLSSPAAQFFQAGDYEKALEALDRLTERYAEDSLLLRYRAICLDRLGRSKEAIEIFKEILEINPDHLPTLYFLGQAYFRLRNESGVRSAWEKVVEQGEGTPYAEWASEGLGHIPITLELPRPKPPRWNFSARAGYEFDSNVLLKPDDKSLANPGSPNANRFTLGSRLDYRAFSGETWEVDGSYEFQQTLHDDGLDEFNFTFQDFGMNARKLLRLGNRSVIAGAQYSLLPGFLNGDLFSFSQRWTVSADTRWTPGTRTLIFDRMSLSNFGPDGFRPKDTSRDGFYQDAGLIHYWYPRNFRNYVFLQEEFTSAFTRGDNFDRLGNTTRVGTHFAFGERTGLDVSGGFRFGGYPHFSSLSAGDVSRRRDFEWDLNISLTHQLTNRTAVRGFYRYANSVNQNNFFDYTRHVGGVEFVIT